MNKLAVITGGTKGIGRALIHQFASAGFDIITCSRNEQDLERLRVEFAGTYSGVSLFARRSDLSYKPEVVDFINFIYSNCSHVDVLINNTGTYLPGSVYNEPDGQLETMIHTNLYSAYHLTRGILPQMIHDRRGHVFNICSIASIMPYANGGSYSISKYAIFGMTKVLREEMKPYGIRVTAVLPGATYTSSWEGVDLPETRFIKAEDIANAVFSVYSLSPQTVVEEILIRPQEGDV